MSAQRHCHQQTVSRVVGSGLCQLLQSKTAYRSRGRSVLCSSRAYMITLAVNSISAQNAISALFIENKAMVLPKLLTEAESTF